MQKSCKSDKQYEYKNKEVEIKKGQFFLTQLNTVIKWKLRNN